MKQFLLLILVTALCSVSAYAKHIIGGEIFYTKIAGTNNYKVTLKVYRDCSCTACADFDAPADFAVFNASGTTVKTFSVFNFVKSPVSLNSNSCALNTGTACVEQGVYDTTITLPPLVGGYDITYQRCCRNGTITNLSSPSSEGATFTTHIPGSDVVTHNSSPRFTNLPPVFLCFTQNINFDNSATDPDGDLLVYELCTPNTGGDQTNPKPTSAQETAPPYTPVVFSPPYSSTNPMPANPAIAINSNTGLITGIPNVAGLFVFAVCVKEYRNGVLLNTTSRDYQFKVLDCGLPNAVISSTTPVINNTLSNGTKVVCNGFNITFNGQQDVGSNYSWDFGVPIVTTDVSAAQNPAYTFPDTGVYIIRLITTKNANATCSDTAFDTIKIQRNFKPDLTYFPTGDQCLLNNSFNYKIIGAFDPAEAVFTWDFLNAASNNTLTGETQTNVHFNTSGYFQVKVNGKQGDCKWSSTLPTRVWAPRIDPSPFVAPLPCTGLTHPYKVSGQEFTNIKWDFGVPSITTDVATGTNVNYTYLDTGAYTITAVANLIITNATPTITCRDTAIFQVRVTNPITLAVSDSGKYCTDDGLLQFKATGTNLTGATYLWNIPQHPTPIGPAAIISNVQFPTAGDYFIDLKAYNYGCAAQTNTTLHMYPNPKINYTASPLKGCQPLEVAFTPTITAEGTVNYNWIMGNAQNTTYNLANPIHTYKDTGTFYTTVMMNTLTGCIDTAYDTLNKPIIVLPRPTAKFTVDSLVKDFFYDPFIKVTNKVTSPYTNLYYSWGDVHPYTYLANDTHYYAQPGNYIITQYVVNALGCSNTTSQEISIDASFQFYVPNAFTPDHDGLNDVFTAKTSGLKEYKLNIYDRWGERVFISNDIKNGWNGRKHNSGDLLPVGVYIWHIQVRDRLSTKRTYTGTVTLVK
jgi:gliding motility-associated-like protein